MLRQEPCRRADTQGPCALRVFARSRGLRPTLPDTMNRSCRIPDKACFPLSDMEVQGPGGARPRSPAPSSDRRASAVDRPDRPGSTPRGGGHGPRPEPPRRRALLPSGGHTRDPARLARDAGGARGNGGYRAQVALAVTVAASRRGVPTSRRALLDTLGGPSFRFNLSGNRRAIATDDPRLADRVADNLTFHEMTESETLIFGTDFGIVADIETGQAATSSWSRRIGVRPTRWLAGGRRPTGRAIPRCRGSVGNSVSTALAEGRGPSRGWRTRRPFVNSSCQS